MIRGFRRARELEGNSFIKLQSLCLVSTHANRQQQKKKKKKSVLTAVTSAVAPPTDGRVLQE